MNKEIPFSSRVARVVGTAAIVSGGVALMIDDLMGKAEAAGKTCTIESLTIKDNPGGVVTILDGNGKRLAELGPVTIRPETTPRFEATCDSNNAALIVAVNKSGARQSKIVPDYGRDSFDFSQIYTPVPAATPRVEYKPVPVATRVEVQPTAAHYEQPKSATPEPVKPTVVSIEPTRTALAEPKPVPTKEVATPESTSVPLPNIFNKECEIIHSNEATLGSVVRSILGLPNTIWRVFFNAPRECVPANIINILGLPILGAGLYGLIRGIVGLVRRFRGGNPATPDAAPVGPVAPAPAAPVNPVDAL